MLNALFRRSASHPEILKEYRAFIEEYEHLGHLCRVATGEPSTQCVYLPHHPVFRDSSITTHLRVVFNASSLTTNRTSLNDHLLTGFKLQNDLSAVILRWRQFRFVYSADIAKMYRQILVDARDADYQRILWRHSLLDPVIEYQLLTVTYGMACAPFLALRILRQLAQDEGSQFPLAVPILRDHCYVDDVLFGYYDEQTLRETRDQLNALLHRGGFKLRKWASNSAALLSDIDTTDHSIACHKSLSSHDKLKILGIDWNPELDAFQTLWKSGVSWDAHVADDTFRRWQRICVGISSLSDLRVPRWSGFMPNCQHELHGFSGASNVAYAAAVYLKVIDPSDRVTITLLQGKSKVAPLKTISIPQMELLGATLLARLLESVSLL
ncbi:uncharacterized protein LOC116852716 [Odontomachus brunneus]|uniref:uncharacterized protein LOC116852716 n=1 Tax=Odontomachus brunneus TaxID=486640 RepID=UPI0013F203B6|nr:uncharacterized protein LOC116852716 [Odontomachus brunneus]